VSAQELAATPLRLVRKTLFYRVVQWESNEDVQVL
jgi:hypothetical protein